MFAKVAPSNTSVSACASINRTCKRTAPAVILSSPVPPVTAAVARLGRSTWKPPEFPEASIVLTCFEADPRQYQLYQHQ